HTRLTPTLDKPLRFPNGEPGTDAHDNNNAQVAQITSQCNDLKSASNVTVTMPAGTYYLHDLNVGAGGTLNITGPVTIYVYHNLTMNGNTTTAANLPKNLKIIMCPDTNGAAPGPVAIGSTSALYSDISAPQSLVTRSGSGEIY